MDEQNIPFNKPYVAGKELYYIAQAFRLGTFPQTGVLQACTNSCAKFNLGSSLMVTSCTSALEMAAILCNLEPGDEIILPSYAFVPANAFVTLEPNRLC